MFPTKGHLQVFFRLTVSLSLVPRITQHHQHLETDDGEDHLRCTGSMCSDRWISHTHKS